MTSEYMIMNNRYRVELGKRGGVKVYSCVSSKTTPLKVNGKHKDGLRWVNLSYGKGSPYNGYTLENIKDHLSGAELVPLTSEDILILKGETLPPPLLDTVESIESLPIEQNGYKESYTEYLNHYTRYYTKQTYHNTSNGFIKFVYNVTVKCEDTNTYTNSKTKVFSEDNKVTFDIRELKSIDHKDLETITGLLNDEMMLRKAKYKAEMEDLIK